MSAKDDLDRFERACVEIANWYSSRSNKETPVNNVFGDLRPFVPAVLRELWSNDDSFWEHLATLCQKERRRLRLAARAEAEATLREISEGSE